MLMNVFNMGFVESILLQKDKEPLFVDCGSKQKENASSRIEWIRSCMNAPRALALCLPSGPSLSANIKVRSVPPATTSQTGLS